MSKIKIIIECDDAQTARSMLEKLENRSDTATIVEKSDTKSTPSPDDAVVDSDGMPWDEAVHASSRSMNVDGTWKAARGQAQAAKDARAAFKAGGGDIEPPIVEEAEEVELPGSKAEDESPSLPGAEKIPPSEPVTMTQFATKASETIESGKIDNDGIVAMYLDVTGADSTDAAVKIFNTNETMRRAALERLNAL